MNRYIILVLSETSWFIHLQTSDKAFVERTADTLARQGAQFRVVDTARAVNW